MNKTITINGKSYPVCFDMQTLINFEEITGRSFFASTFSTITDKVAVIAAAALSADKESDITIQAILGGKDWEACKQILAAFNVVSEEVAAFFPIPEVEPKDEPKPEDKEESPKN